MSVKIAFYFEVLKIKQFYLSSSYQSFQKKQRITNICERELKF